MGFIENCKSFLSSSADCLRGAAKRLFMARAVAEHGPGGQAAAERELGWSRVTVRKGTHELKSGVACADAFHLRGRKPLEERLPNLLADIRDIADSQSPADPRFRTLRLYTRLSAAEVRRRLIAGKGYRDDQLPTEETIRVRLNRLGYRVRSVQKNRPRKKLRRPTPSSRSSRPSTSPPTPTRPSCG